ncbi:MAG: hypothetical protein ACUVWN_03155 [bacterium]
MLDALKEALSYSGLASAFVPNQLGASIQKVCTTKAAQCNSYSVICSSYGAVCSGTCAAWCNSNSNAVCTTASAHCQSISECNNS